MLTSRTPASADRAAPAPPWLPSQLQSFSTAATSTSAPVCRAAAARLRSTTAPRPTAELPDTPLAPIPVAAAGSGSPHDTRFRCTTQPSHRNTAAAAAAPVDASSPAGPAPAPLPAPPPPPTSTPPPTASGAAAAGATSSKLTQAKPCASVTSVHVKDTRCTADAPVTYIAPYAGKRCPARPAAATASAGEVAAAGHAPPLAAGNGGRPELPVSRARVRPAADTRLQLRHWSSGATGLSGRSVMLEPSRLRCARLTNVTPQSSMNGLLWLDDCSCEAAKPLAAVPAKARPLTRFTPRVDAHLRSHR